MGTRRSQFSAQNRHEIRNALILFERTSNGVEKELFLQTQKTRVQHIPTYDGRRHHYVNFEWVTKTVSMQAR